ncbi:MAG: hypothetical protein EXR53_06185 [Dehalococcoidia bacterium]|nr:hypothetical protein [Dehalococcoidia bacterium]
MRVHILILGLALMLGLGLTACGQDAPTPAPAPIATATARPAIPTPAPTATPTSVPATPTATPVPPTPTAAAAPTATARAVTKATVKVTAHAKLGNILTDLSGRTLYTFSRDERNKSTCSGTCVETWLPLLTAGDPTAGDGVTQATLGVIQRTEGGIQVVYNGRPLYHNVQDTAAGDAKGQNVGTLWFVLSGDGSPIQDAAQIKTVSSPALGTIITDRSGRTLYLASRDEANKSNVTGNTTRSRPPVLTIGDPTAGEGAAANLLGTLKRAEGSTQVTYKGRPLYYYARDDKPGDTN